MLQSGQAALPPTRRICLPASRQPQCGQRGGGDASGRRLRLNWRKYSQYETTAAGTGVANSEMRNHTHPRRLYRRIDQPVWAAAATHTPTSRAHFQ